MAVGLTKLWSTEYHKKYTTYGVIAGFNKYATGGVTFDLCGALGLNNADTFVQLESSATYNTVFDKATNKIFLSVATTGVELTNSTTISSLNIKALVIGKRL